MNKRLLEMPRSVAIKCLDTYLSHEYSRPKYESMTNEKIEEEFCLSGVFNAVFDDYDIELTEDEFTVVDDPAPETTVIDPDDSDDDDDGEPAY